MAWSRIIRRHEVRTVLRTNAFLLIVWHLARMPLLAQYPPIGIIDFYGLRTVSETEVRNVLGIQEGDPFPASGPAEAENRLEGIPGVSRARLELTCCEADKAILYVGIEETGAPRLTFRKPPTTHLELPGKIAETYRQFDDAVQEAILKGDAADDISQGHSLMANPAARALQDRFVVYAGRYLHDLRRVLSRSADVEQRAIAAWVIGYAPKKAVVVDDLEHAMRDPDDVVRNNAMRALWAIASFSRRRFEPGIRISPAPLIGLLNSMVWSDRNKAMAVLEALTQDRDTRVLRELRLSALSSLAEMARWKSQGHAFAAYVLLGRVGGLSEREIADSWSRGERESAIARILEPGQANDDHHEGARERKPHRSPTATTP